MVGLLLSPISSPQDHCRALRDCDQGHAVLKRLEAPIACLEAVIAISAACHCLLGRRESGIRSCHVDIDMTSRLARIHASQAWALAMPRAT